jgi:hypothetical protein
MEIRTVQGSDMHWWIVNIKFQSQMFSFVWALMCEFKPWHAWWELLPKCEFKPWRAWWELLPMEFKPWRALWELLPLCEFKPWRAWWELLPKCEFKPWRPWWELLPVTFLVALWELLLWSDELSPHWARKQFELQHRYQIKFTKKKHGPQFYFGADGNWGRRRLCFTAACELVPDGVIQGLDTPSDKVRCCQLKIVNKLFIPTGSLWRRQSQQSFNTLTPFNFLSHSLHVLAPTGHLQVRYTIRYFKDYF